MKVTCPISGIHYSVTMPVRGTSVAVHPMLSSSVRVVNLVDWYLKDWTTGELSPEVVHLLGIAFVQKLPIESIAFAPLGERELEVLGKTWASNMERAAKLAAKLESRGRQFRRLQRFVLNAETAHCLGEWLKDLEVAVSLSSEPISEKAKELNRAAYKTLVDSSSSTVARLLEPEQVENMILRSLNDSPLTGSEVKALPVVLADWANKVTSFPSNQATRYQRIIQTIFDGDYINKILMSDITVIQIRALEEHLVLNTPSQAVGTSHSRLLMDRLHKVIPVIEDFSPELVSRRKGAGEDSLLGALMGDTEGSSVLVPSKSQSPAVSGSAAQSKSTGKPMTLAEKLAARIAGKVAVTEKAE